MECGYEWNGDQFQSELEKEGYLPATCPECGEEAGIYLLEQKELDIGEVMDMLTVS